MKIFTVFTKQGKVEFPIKDSEAAKAEAVAKSPLMDVTEKLREMNDLSNKLTKAELHELSSKLEKVEFIDVDGNKVTLLKGDKSNTWSAPEPEVKEPAPVVKPKADGVDDKKIANEYAKTSVPMKHQESAKAYINSDKFKEDVKRHSDNHAKEISDLGYPQGPHPAVRALNEHLHPLMTKSEFDEYADLEKIGWTDEAREAAAQARKQGSGGQKISGKTAHQFVDRKLSFATTNGQMYGKSHPNGTYAVYSYGDHFPMYANDGTGWHGNSDKYSVTTAKHQNFARPSGPITYHNTEGLKGFISGMGKSVDSLRNLAGKISKDNSKK